MNNERTQRGFTLIELLVVVAIIALLLAVLLPALKSAKSYAKRVVCAGRLNQLGKAMRMYADAQDDRIPDNLCTDGDPEDHAYIAYRADEILPNGKYKPFRLAYFYETGLIELPEIFYCPGNNPLYAPSYVYENYIHPAPWGTLPQEYVNEFGNLWVRVGYVYFPVAQRPEINPATYAPDYFPKKFMQVNTNLPYLSDLIHNRQSVAHQNNGNYALNVVYTDGHIATCVDQDVFAVLADPSSRNVWDSLDAGGYNYNTAIYSVFRAIGSK